MMRARRTIAMPDDEGDDGVAVPTWIMGIPYTGGGQWGGKTRRTAVYIFFRFESNSAFNPSSYAVYAQRQRTYQVVQREKYLVAVGGCYEPR